MSLAPRALLLLISAALGAETSEELHVRRIQPLMQDKCLGCHGRDPEKIKGELDLRKPDALLKGGESGKPSIVPGRPQESPMFLSVERVHEDWEPMPPKQAEKLTPEQVGWVRDWIAKGAAIPGPDRAKEILQARKAAWDAEDGVMMKTGGGLSPEWDARRYKPESLWAFRPLTNPSPPAAGHPVDAFIAARMPEGLMPAPAADRRALLRRVSLDLSGLPPTEAEAEDFIADKSDDATAFAKVVDRLLASPHYGERMAQHWLDVVRYADSSGFANDYERGGAWRYRDYVVRSFNADKPYDRFVREQVAGDEIAPDDPEMLVAVGFLRMGPWELTSMEVPKVARQRFLDDVTNAVGETFLAQSLQCARCHDHKFDPVATRDYYAVQAVFRTTQLAERPAAFLPTENLGGFDERKHLLAAREAHEETLRQLDEKSLAATEAWFRSTRVDEAPWKEALAKAGKARGSRFAGARQYLLNRKVPEDKFPPRMLGWTPEEIGLERIARKGLERLKWELDRYEPFALSVYDGRTPNVTSVSSPVRPPADPFAQGEWEDEVILIGGDPFSAGPKVAPGVLGVLTDVPSAVPSFPVGRRKGLAEWIVHPSNPLTARAIVNRVWQWHFGRPLAANPNNFGSTGGRPTHPELLDWLASDFIAKGRSFKTLHRLILSSEAYRRASVHPDPSAVAAKDPKGESLAVFPARRLTAEELRDSMLAATGELNRAVGGIPCRPEINQEAALQPRQVMGTFASAWTPNPRPEQRHRRSLYVLRLRGLPDPRMEVFNQPGADFSCERREESVVAPQAFALFNGADTHARALALAAKSARDADDAEAVRRCFRAALGRNPSPAESRESLAHWTRVRSLLGPKPAPVRPPVEVRRDAIEENTGTPFSFTERLHANVEFVPDLQPDDVDDRVRSLADLCLVLFNSNEFAHAP